MQLLNACRGCVRIVRDIVKLHFLVLSDCKGRRKVVAEKDCSVLVGVLDTDKRSVQSSFHNIDVDTIREQTVTFCNELDCVASCCQR